MIFFVRAFRLLSSWIMLHVESLMQMLRQTWLKVLQMVVLIPVVPCLAAKLQKCLIFMMMENMTLPALVLVLVKKRI